MVHYRINWKKKKNRKLNTEAITWFTSSKFQNLISSQPSLRIWLMSINIKTKPKNFESCSIKIKTLWKRSYYRTPFSSCTIFLFSYTNSKRDLKKLNQCEESEHRNIQSGKFYKNKTDSWLYISKERKLPSTRRIRLRQIKKHWDCQISYKQGNDRKRRMKKPRNRNESLPFSRKNLERDSEELGFSRKRLGREAHRKR